MDVTWKDLLVLVQSNNNVSETCDAIVETLEADVTALPDVFHALTFELLISKEFTTRVNASLLVGKLGLFFAEVIASLICNSNSDGDFLTLQDVKVHTILSTPGAALLSKLSNGSPSSKSTNKSVYTKEWLSEQRRELKVRMGLGVPIHALDDISDNYITEEDFSSGHSSVESSYPLPYTLNVAKDTITEESWLARIVRCMIVGLLHPQWEIRHGYSLGLSQLLRGVFPDIMKKQKPNQECERSFLPEFICNDILCCGLCVLLLDRFVDFGVSSGGSVAPVKEVAGELLACAMRCSQFSEGKTSLLWSLLCDMTVTTEHWTVALGGFIALKHFVPQYLEFVVEEKWQECVQLVSVGIRSTEMEVVEAACATVCAFSCAALQSSTGGEAPERRVLLDGVVQWLKVLCETMPQSYLSLEDPPSLVRSWSDAIRSVAAMSSEIFDLRAVRVDDAVPFAEIVLQACDVLLGKLPLYDSATRGHCLSNVTCCVKALSVLFDAMNFTSGDRRLHALKMKLMNVLGSAVAAGCLSSLRPIVELQLDDIANSRPSKRRPAQSKINKMFDVDFGHDSSDLVSAYSPELPTSRLSIEHHHEERALLEGLMTAWVDLAVILCLNLQSSPIEEFLLIAAERLLGVVLPAISGDGSYSDGALRSFKAALDMFCAVEVARRPLQDGAAVDLAALIHTDQFDFLVVIVFSLSRSWTILRSDSSAGALPALGSSISLIASAAQASLLKRKPSQTQTEIPPPKKRIFRFVVVADSAEQAKTESVPSTSAVSVRDSSDARNLLGVRCTARFLSLTCAEFGDSVNVQQRGLVIDLLRTLQLKAAEWPLTAMGFAAANNPRNTLLSYRTARPDDLRDSHVQLFVAVATARKLSLDPDINREIEPVWTLFENGRAAEEFASQITYTLAKESQSIYLDLFSDLFSRSSAERIRMQALRASTPAARVELSTRFDVVGQELISVGTLADPSGRFVRDAADILLTLVESHDETGARSNSKLSDVVGRLYLLLFEEEKVEFRGQVAGLLEHLATGLREHTLDAYEILFATALRGLGDWDVAVRRPCVRVFRLLVPLASLAKQTAARRLLVRPINLHDAAHLAVGRSSELLQHIFTKQNPFRLEESQHPRDLKIMAYLSEQTNLLSKRHSTLSPAQLRDYQWEGVSWLTQLRRFGLNGILADEMGLGKSLQALTALAVLRIEKSQQTAPALIVCPASVVLHWTDEVKKFFPASVLLAVAFAPGLSTAAITSSGATVVIVSYEMLRRDVTSGHRSVLKGIVWEMVILDEAHLVKNPSAGSTRAVCSLQSLHRMALSGTPVQNQVEELWSLMNFLLPDYIGEYKQFRKDVVNPILRSFTARKELRGMQQLPQSEPSSESAKGKRRDDPLAKFHQVVNISTMGLNLLRNLHKQVLPFILRRSKEMVASDLPSKTVIDLLCPLSAEQKQLYASYQQRLCTSDELLMREYLSARDGAMGEDAELSSLNLSAAELATRTAQMPAETSVVSVGWSSGSGATSMNIPSFDAEEDALVEPSSKPRTLEALKYLKLLCLHPALVVDSSHSKFRTRLLESPASSGKLVRLALLLIDSGVVTREEIGSTHCVDDLLQLDGALMERVGAPGGVVASEESGEEEDEEERQETEEAEVESALSKSPERNVSTDTADEKASLGAATHSGSSMEEELAAPLHRCLIFAQHRAALDLVEELVLKQYFPSVGYERMDGSMEPAKRAAVARKFNEQQLSAPRACRAGKRENVHANQVALLMSAFPTAAVDSCRGTEPEGGLRGKDIRILLMTTRSCGLGLNLTAADTVIFLEHDWNPFADLQAMDRVHRIGQTQPVTVYRLLAESTVEARIMKLQSLKQGVAAQIINAENAGSAGNVDGAAPRQQFGNVLMGSLLLRPDIIN